MHTTEQDPHDADDEDPDGSSNNNSAFTTKELRSFFQDADGLCAHMVGKDLLLEQAIKFKLGLDELAPYR